MSGTGSHTLQAPRVSATSTVVVTSKVRQPSTLGSKRRSCASAGQIGSDVATALAMPVNTVKTHLRRARIALARALARRNAVLRREVS